MSWPDGGATPFRGEKDTNWEGGWRVPCVMRWPGVIKPGRVINDICSLQDFIPTFAAASGEPDLVEKVKKGYKIGGKTFKVHLDGFNLLPFLSGKEEKSPREGFIYWSDDGDCMAMRVGRYKVVFAEQRKHGPRRLARAAVADAHPEVLRPARRSVRARRGELQVQRLVRREHASPVRGASRSSTSGWRASRSFRRAPRRRASPSTRWSQKLMPKNLIAMARQRRHLTRMTPPAAASLGWPSAQRRSILTVYSTGGCPIRC